MNADDTAAVLDHPASHDRAMGAVRRGGSRNSGGMMPAMAGTLPCASARSISEILRAVGKPVFYPILSAQMASLLGCDRHLVMRYSRFAKPTFLVNNFMHGKLESLYLDKLYKLDPLHKMAREGRQCTVSTLRGSPMEANHTEYCSTLFHRAAISDELALVLPMFGGAFIAICLDKRPECGLFDGVSVALARELYPIVRQAHLLHLERSLPGPSLGPLDGTATPVLVTTADHEVVCKNEAWSDVERSALSGPLKRIMELGCVGKNVHLGGSIVHGHRLDGHNPVCGNGNIFFIEPQSASSPGVGFDNILDVVADRYHLSPRERDLLTLALDGCGTRMIAERLGLSAGTIKNYKLRLYAKLGIRSEREMASLLIGFLGGAGNAT